MKPLANRGRIATIAKFGNRRGKRSESLCPNPAMPLPSNTYDDAEPHHARASRNWVFTLFHYTWEMVCALLDAPVRGIIFQEEVCPTTGHRHLQGFARFKKGVTKRQAYTALASREDMAHLWLRFSIAPAAAVEYCRKGETRDGETWEEGDLEFTQGKSNRMSECIAMLMEGASLRDATLEYPEQFFLHDRGFAKLRAQVLRDTVPLWRSVHVYVLYGRSGAGKTRAAYEYCPGLYKLDRASSTGVWFDGYDGETTLLLDDFYGWVPYSQLLNLLDGYHCRLDIKGAFAYAAWSTVIITSNTPPTEWYRKIFPSGVPPALARRITAAYECTDDTDHNDLVSFLRGRLEGHAVVGHPDAAAPVINEHSDPRLFPGSGHAPGV